MNLITDTIFTALKVWINTALIAILGITVFIGLSDGALNIGQIFLITTICTLVGSFPACILLCLGIHPIRKSCITLRKKCWLYIGVLGIIALFYGICSTLFFW